MEAAPLLEFSNRQQLREWLEKNHATATHCWVTAFRSRVPEGIALPYIEIVEEALCFGWIDSTNKKLPDGRLAQRISPRRKGSHWTELNKQRCADLQKRGLMTDGGRAALPAEIETRRLRFRLWRESDAEALFKYASDPDVGPRADILPIMCETDYTVADRIGVCLHRDKTLATGDACCDYLYTRPGSEIEKKWQAEHPEGTFNSK